MHLLPDTAAQVVDVNIRRQKGFTLTELMVSTALSLSIVGIVLTLYVATSTRAISTLAESKLNHELASLMSLMGDDIRRAGYWGVMSAPDSKVVNPFNVTNQSALTVFDSLTSNNIVGPSGIGTCITYSYDINRNGSLESAELIGFRLNNGAVQMRTSGTSGLASCKNTTDVWEDLTDRAQITVTVLSFDLGESACVNTREPDGRDNDGNGTIDNTEEADCYRAPLPTDGSGNITLETREVRITLEGSLVSDAFARLMQSQTVRVRNELIRRR
jgi:prepilin peptidase dependent protein B